MSALVKICGIQSIEMIDAIAHMPMDYIGFVFAKSRRQVTANQAGEMIARLRERTGSQIETVGVFVNPTLDELRAIVAVAPLDVIQLHGQEIPECCQLIKDTLGKKVFKVFSVPPVEDGLMGVQTVVEQLDAYKDCVDAIMLDTFDPVTGGGSGKTFSWEHIPMVQQWSKQNGCPLLIAGGLNPDNVERLINAYSPNGVDVSSGVETEGMKDPIKIRTFIERVKQS